MSLIYSSGQWQILHTSKWTWDRGSLLFQINSAQCSIAWCKMLKKQRAHIFDIQIGWQNDHNIKAWVMTPVKLQELITTNHKTKIYIIVLKKNKTRTGVKMKMICLLFLAFIQPQSQSSICILMHWILLSDFYLSKKGRNITGKSLVIQT